MLYFDEFKMEAAIHSRARSDLEVRTSQVVSLWNLGSLCPYFKRGFLETLHNQEQPSHFYFILFY